ncbi:C2H2 transcriptional regulator [Trichoderma cornu-damae]|uniref:C2H2 transcriptional regulator n=1 Tax=Trichoderma cornu-damae TaxID=654480 RepID=A0A9P8QDN0_9HYPO|nr:C2H2 transcriptional regulator [Trichoderma cornu-damae]
MCNLPGLGPQLLLFPRRAAGLPRSLPLSTQLSCRVSVSGVIGPPLPPAPRLQLQHHRQFDHRPTSPRTRRAPPSIAIIKTEPSSFADDVSRAWAAAAARLTACAGPKLHSPTPPPFYLARDAINIPITAPASPVSVHQLGILPAARLHMVRVNSARSSMSWASASVVARTQPSLLVTPAGSSAVSAGKTNVYWVHLRETSFKRKHDWKRHEDEFHERWRKYPCPEPGCNCSFWGSNSVQPTPQAMPRLQDVSPTRKRSSGRLMHSRVVYGLLHQPLIHEAWEALVTGKQAEFKGRRPQFSWHPSKTGRAQGFLEKENPG